MSRSKKSILSKPDNKQKTRIDFTEGGGLRINGVLCDGILIFKHQKSNQPPTAEEPIYIIFGGKKTAGSSVIQFMPKFIRDWLYLLGWVVKRETMNDGRPVLMVGPADKEIDAYLPILPTDSIDEIKQELIFRNDAKAGSA